MGRARREEAALLTFNFAPFPHADTMSSGNMRAMQPTARRRSLPTDDRSVSFNARIDVLIIPARPHTGDDAAQHTNAKPTARRHSLPACGRSVSFNANIDVLIIPARPHAGDDAAQHMTAEPTMTRCHSWNLAPRCFHCGTQRAVLERCSSCKQTSYCGKGCQTAAWKVHKKTCAPPLSLEDVVEKLTAASLRQSESDDTVPAVCNDVDLRLESPEYDAVFEDDASSWLSSWLSVQSTKSA
jgi:hypothetical protein